MNKPSLPDQANSRFVYLAAFISALGGLLFGYDTGVISGAILFVRQDFSLSDGMVSVVVGCVLLGALLGAVVGGTVADRFGRRRVIIATAALFFIGAIGTALAPNEIWLIAGRVLLGAAIGVASFTTPLYISEVSPPALRGRLVSLNQLAVTIGIVVAYLVDYGLADARAWRWMFGLAAIPGALLGLGMLWLPESPRWLLGQKQRKAAEQVLKRIRGRAEVDEEFAEMQRNLKEDSSGDWRTLFRPAMRAALLVGVGLAVAQQVTGINTVIYYAPMIFGYAGITSAASSILATVGVGMINVILTIVAFLLVDRVGRRPLLLVGLAGMIVGLIALGLAFAQPSLAGPTLGWIAAGSLALYVGSFAVGLGPVFWLLISEIYPLKIRGLAMSVSTAFNWGANLFVTLTFLALIHGVGRSFTFWIYAAVGVGSWLFVWFLVPETKGTQPRGN